MKLKVHQNTGIHSEPGNRRERFYTRIRFTCFIPGPVGAWPRRLYRADTFLQYSGFTRFEWGNL